MYREYDSAIELISEEIYGGEMNRDLIQFVQNTIDWMSKSQLRSFCFEELSLDIEYNGTKVRNYYVD